MKLVNLRWVVQVLNDSKINVNQNQRLINRVFVEVSWSRA